MLYIFDGIAWNVMEGDYLRSVDKNIVWRAISITRPPDWYEFKTVKLQCIYGSDKDVILKADEWCRNDDHPSS